MNSMKRYFEELELSTLDPRAAFSASATRTHKEPDEDFRTEFQRDRDRILHSESFRRIRSKTQVFIMPLRDNVRTRLVHTLEVSQIARTICRALRFNEDLVEAIALGHDLGHTPFGHQGEAIIQEFIPGFHHAKQSLRVVERLEKDGKGLNLTEETRDGILRHTKGKGAIFLPAGDSFLPKTVEAQIVRIADALAYLASDIDDALELGVIRIDEFPPGLLDRLGGRYSQRLGTMVSAVIEGSRDSDRIGMTEEVGELTQRLKDFMYCEVYPREVEVRSEPDPGDVIRTLFDYYLSYPHLVREKKRFRSLPDEPDREIVKDYIASLGDQEAVAEYRTVLEQRQSAT